jgi:hypothetical protein
MAAPGRTFTSLSQHPKIGTFTIPKRELPL